MLENSGVLFNKLAEGNIVGKQFKDKGSAGNDAQTMELTLAR